MKWKYFLRGLGVGIIFSTLIFLVAYMTSGSNKMTDSQVIDRAKELGMVEKSGILAGSEDVSENDNTKEKSTDDIKKTTTQSTSEEKEDLTDQSTTGATTENGATTEAITTTEKNTSDKTFVTAKISVTNGMHSSTVAKLLMDADIIDDADEFDAYLMENGYSTRIRVDNYTFTNEMTYEEIANRLMKVDE